MAKDICLLSISHGERFPNLASAALRKEGRNEKRKKSIYGTISSTFKAACHGKF